MTIMKPAYFNAKKWTIMSVTGIKLLITLIMMIVVLSDVKKYALDLLESEIASGNKMSFEDAKKTVIMATIVAAVFSILISSIGLFGAYKEHYCLSITYAVLLTLGCILDLIHATKVHVMWLGFVISLAILLVQIWFVVDLHKIRRS